MKRKPSLVRGLLTGAAAGLAGSLAMAGFQERIAHSQQSRNRQGAPQRTHAPQPGQENTTETTARRVITAFGRTPSGAEKYVAGRALHYGFGIVMGAVYGVAAEYLPLVGLGAGSVFGTVLFLGTDEATLPLLHLASKPADTPPVEHILHWVSHVVYSSTLELTRKQLVRLG